MICTTWPFLPFTCRLLFIMSTQKLVVSCQAHPYYLYSLIIFIFNYFGQFLFNHFLIWQTVKLNYLMFAVCRKCDLKTLYHNVFSLRANNFWLVTAANSLRSFFLVRFTWMVSGLGTKYEAGKKAACDITPPSPPPAPAPPKKARKQSQFQSKSHVMKKPEPAKNHRLRPCIWILTHMQISFAKTRETGSFYALLGFVFLISA